MAASLNGGEEQLQTLLIGLDRRCEPTFVTDIDRVLSVLLLRHRLQAVVDLGTDLHRLGK